MGSSGPIIPKTGSDNLHNGDLLSAVTVGNSLAFAGLPGEPFTAYGTALKEKSPFRMTVPACLVNGHLDQLNRLFSEGTRH